MVHSQLRRNRSVVNLVNLVNLTRFPSELTGAALTLLALEGIIDYMRSCIANGKAILSLLGLLCFQSVNLCAGTLSATDRFQPLARTDAVLICVPTPLTANREPAAGSG